MLEMKWRMPAPTAKPAPGPNVQCRCIISFPEFPEIIATWVPFNWLDRELPQTALEAKPTSINRHVTPKNKNKSPKTQGGIFSLRQHAPIKTTSQETQPTTVAMSPMERPDFQAASPVPCTYAAFGHEHDKLPLTGALNIECPYPTEHDWLIWSKVVST